MRLEHWSALVTLLMDSQSSRSREPQLRMQLQNDQSSKAA